MSEKKMVEKKIECGWTGCEKVHTRTAEERTVEGGWVQKTFNPFLPDGWDTVPGHWRKRLIADGVMKKDGWVLCPEHAMAPDEYLSK